MPVTQEQFVELLSIVDAHAGKEHSQTGRVAEALSAVLARYDEMLGEQLREALRGKDSGVWTSTDGGKTFLSGPTGITDVESR